MRSNLAPYLGVLIAAVLAACLGACAEDPDLNEYSFEGEDASAADSGAGAAVAPAAEPASAETPVPAAAPVAAAVASTDAGSPDWPADAPMKTATVREALRDAMAEEMRRSDNVFLMGEEVGEYQGAYKISQGLLDEFGPRRVIDTPITEHGLKTYP